MSSTRTVSLVAERAVRYLREADQPIDSRRLAREVLSTTAPDERTARRLLETAFSGDARLRYRRGTWRLAPTTRTRRRQRHPIDRVEQPDRVLLFVEGRRRVPGQPFELNTICALRLQGDSVVAACGGDAAEGVQGRRLRRAVLQALDGAIPIIHDAPGAVRALERWLGQPLASPVSLRRLAQDRLGLGRGHDLKALAAGLGLHWRDTDDPLELADTMDACLRALLQPDEPLAQVRARQGAGPAPLDWSRFAFDRRFVQEIPRVPGTYRFYDADDNLVYVGKSKNLAQRIGSYFRETGRPRAPRVQRLVDRVHRIEYEPTGSDLEAMLREAEQIRQRQPRDNVQRNVHRRSGRSARLWSILILEPAEPPAVLRAYLVRDGRLLARVPIGARGGGLKRIARVLEDHYFSAPVGPTPVTGRDLDVEVVARWLAAHRHRVIAFDPTDLRTADEVVERLRWFLHHGEPFDPDGAPIVRR